MTNYSYIAGDKPVELLALDRCWPPAADVRYSASPGRVKQFAEMTLVGILFPHVTVVKLGPEDDRFCILDGLHRRLASLLAGFSEIPACFNRAWFQ